MICRYRSLIHGNKSQSDFLISDDEKNLHLLIDRSDLQIFLYAYLIGIIRFD